MKKILSVFLAAVLTFSMATQAFASSQTGKKSVKTTEPTAYELYADAMDNMGDLDNFAMYMAFAMYMDMFGMTMDLFTIEMAMAVDATGDDPQLALEMGMYQAIDESESDIYMYMYVKDGIVYIKYDGDKVAMSMENLLESIGGFDLDELGFGGLELGGGLSAFDLSGFDRRAFEQTFIFDHVTDSSVVETDDGTELYFTLDSGYIMDMIVMFASLAGYDTEELADEVFAELFGTDIDYEIGDIEIVVLLDDDGCFYAVGASITLTMIMMEMPIDLVCQFVMEYTQIGDVEIEFPDDLDTYLLVE